MEKYGVDTDAEPKEAQDRTPGTCPSCGTRLVSDEMVNVPKCPRCGTRPFEGGDNAAD